MGIVAICPNGHRIKVKDELAGKKGICPTCAARFRIPHPWSQAAQPVRPEDLADLPTARVVSLDPHVVSMLPAARALAAADAIVSAAGAAARPAGET